MIRSILTAAALAAATTLTPSFLAAQKPRTVVELAAGADGFRTLVAAVEAAGLVDALSGDGPFTVLAPTDEAFDQLGSATLAELLLPRNREQLRAILKLHVIPGRATADAVRKASRAKTLGGTVAIERKGHDLLVGGAKVVRTDLMAGNGVVHVIDSVILPPPAPDLVDLAAKNDDFTTLLAAVRAAGLEETLRGEGPFTVFAPSNRAFAKLPKGTVQALLKPRNREQLVAILKLHVVPGRLTAREVVRREGLESLGGGRLPVETDGRHRVTVGGARLTTVDNEARNGIVHVIDSVILPADTDDSVVAVAEKAGRFSTLLAAVEAAGLTETLRGDGPFTVLAPTDAAFAKLGDTVEELLEPANRGRLQQILKLHVIPARVDAVGALNVGRATTLAGSEVEFTLDGGRLTVGGARVLDNDLEAGNGLVHVLDTVLLPTSRG